MKIKHIKIGQEYRIQKHGMHALLLGEIVKVTAINTFRGTIFNKAPATVQVKVTKGIHAGVPQIVHADSLGKIKIRSGL